MEPITQEHLTTHVPKLTLNHIKRGVSGYVEFALENPLKDRIICVDYARKKIKFKNKDGDIIVDPEMSKLAPMFFESIKDKSTELVYGNQDIENIDSDMLESVAKLFSTNTDVRQASRGIKSEFYHDFVKQVCCASLID